MTTNNITSAQLSFLLSNLVGNNTYKIVDEPSNRFNFFGLTETIDSDAIEAIKSSNVSVYPISSDSIEQVLSVCEDNDVNLNDYTYVLAVQDEDTTTYMLVWGDLTYNVVFNSETNSNSKGFKSTLEDCERYIADNNRTLSSYFEDYKNGTVSIVCNETGETISEIAVVTPINTEVKGFQDEPIQFKPMTPTLPMLYWCVDGWDAELLYKDTAKNKDGVKITTYHKRPTVVMIVDPFNLYPIGYAIGTHETPALIRQAFRNAFEHTNELFGTYYKPWQLQTDNYGNGNLASFYEACATYYTPAKAHNAKAKVIEPFFDKFNRKYLRLCPNSSGFGVKSRSGIQPSSDFLNQQKKDFPDFAGCVAQLDSMIQLDRREKQEAYMAKWAAVADQDKCPLSLSDYLHLFV